MKIRKILMVMIGLGTICCIAYGSLQPETLEVSSREETVLSIPLEHDNTFSLRFIHSVHRTPVWEHFVISPADGLTLVSTEYQSYGVGMPSLPSEGVFIQKSDRFVLQGLNRRFVQIPVRVGPEAKLTLVYKGQEYPLYQYAPPGALLTVHRGTRLFGIIDGLLSHNKSLNKEG